MTTSFVITYALQSNDDVINAIDSLPIPSDWRTKCGSRHNSIAGIFEPQSVGFDAYVKWLNYLRSNLDLDDYLFVQYTNDIEMRFGNLIPDWPTPLVKIYLL